MKNIFSSLAVAAIAKRYSLNYFDIGSRGGFQKDLSPISFAVEVVGFEPDPIEFKYLQSRTPTSWKSVTILPFALSDRSGTQTLNIPIDPQSASLLKHNLAIGKKFKKTHMFEIDRTEEIQTLSLKEALGKTNFESIDFMKIDIEGAELMVFSSSPEIMKNTLAIKTEVSFIPMRNNQPLSSDVDKYLTEIGFELMNIIEPFHWRREGYITHPYYSSGKPPYSKAQIAQADFLYFRNPDSLKGDIPKLIKLSLISLSFGYFDHALMILERTEVKKFLASEFNKTPMEIVAPASRSFGRRIFIKEFYRQGCNLIPFIRYLKNLFYQ
ncbi:MAG: FkbM family methyltransferase [Pseudomonadota bacterium]|nr:FkbM family methyltransferase [Pseudomonadota bacterium]